MAESIVSFVMERLGDLLINEAGFLRGVSGQVEQLQRELRLMKGFLEEADKRQEEDKIVQAWVSEIREAAYDAEDAVETFALGVQSRRRGGVRNKLKRYACIIGEAAELHNVGTEIDAITTRISNLTRSLETYGIKPKSGGEGSSSAHVMQQQWRQSYAHVEEYTVGLDEDVKILVAELLNEKKPYQVVSICGMGGLGKTTLAKMVFHHSAIRRHFDGVAWAYISQQCQRRDFWEGILFKLIPDQQRDEIVRLKLKDDEIAVKLYKVLEEKKCLVILDDIWSLDTWKSLTPAFPIGKIGSKMLLTTRIKEVAQNADPSGFFYEPHCLNEDDGWELLQKKAFTGNHDPDFEINKDMEKLGREIVKKCGGLPLAIVVLGGLLAMKQTSNDWNMVYENISLFRRGKGHEQHHSEVSKVLALSYNELPYQLKPCFLHLSQFPEDFEIPTKKLIRWWIAEGIVSPMQEGEETLEDVADRYLGELLDRCMVQVATRGSTGRVKTCRLHDLMRDLCLSKADEENFVKIIHLQARNKQVGSLSSTRRVHRLAVYLDEEPLKFLLEEKTTLHFRSLLFFSSKRDGTITSEKIISRFSDFKLLKILDMEQCRIYNPKYPFEVKLEGAIGNLIHLRYLGLNCDSIAKVPSSIGNLRCLLTLILKGFENKLIRIPNEIWKMERLRHLYLPTPFNQRKSKGKLRLGNLWDLQTLKGFDTEECDVNELTKLTNLKKLDMELNRLKELVDVLRSSCVSLNRLCSLACKYYSTVEENDLQILFSSCPHLCKLSLSCRPIEKLPECHHFPPKLTKLTLHFSELEEDPMPTLEKLPHLSILRLKAESFTGNQMVCSSRGFPQLKSLVLDRLHYLEEWCVDKEAMCSLRELVIECCENLKMAPDGLKFITTLRELRIITMPQQFQNRLRVGNEGGEDLYKVRHIPSIIFEGNSISLSLN